MRRALRSPALLAGLLLLLQFLLFRTHVLREVSAWYPRFFDQVRYLSHTYAMFEASLDEGLGRQVLSMLWGEAARRPVNGVLVPIEAMVLFNLFGASRLTALAPGFIHYAVWQATMLWMARRQSGSRACSLLCAGLVLTVGSPFVAPAGITDYRFDFPAMCLFGTWIALVLRSDVYVDRRWSIVSGAVAGGLILTRYLTAAYLLGIATVMCGLFAWSSLRRTPPERSAAARARLVNLVLAGLATTLVAGPSLWMGLQSIYDYYLSPRTDHSVWRTAGAGVFTVLRGYAAAAAAHLTVWFAAAVVVAIAAALLSARRVPRSAGERTSTLAALFLCVAFAVPVGFLATYSAQSDGAIGMVIPPIVGLCALAVLAAWRPPPGEGAAARWLRYGAVLAVLGAGILNQLDGYAKRTLRDDERRAVADATRMLERAAWLCEELGWTRPRVSVTAIRDDLAGGGGVLSPLHYERRGVLLEVQGKLGESVFAVDEDAVRRALAESDLVFAAPPETGVAIPFTTAIGPFLPTVQAILDRDFVRLESFRVRDAPVVLYANPRLRVSGISAGWLTSEGTQVTVPRRFLRPGARVVLRGPCATQVPCDLPAVARLMSSGRPPTLLETASATDGSHYELRVFLPDLAAGDEDPLVLRLSFPRFFVPAQSGMSDDPRQLAAWAPTEARVERVGPAGDR